MDAGHSADPGDEARRAANGYLVWPLAAANLVREDAATSAWARLHARQALLLGLTGSGLLLAVLALPLLTVLAFPAISSGATIAVYGAGAAVDLGAILALIVFGVRCAMRAARGDVFAIPLVTPLARRWLGLDPP